MKYNLDLPHHAAVKVKRAMDDVLELADEPAEKLRIALMAASVPIGAASGILAAMCAKAGNEVGETAAIVQILEMLKLNAEKDANAIFASQS